MKWCPIITETKGIAPLGSMKTMLSFGGWIPRVRKEYWIPVEGMEPPRFHRTKR